MTVCTVMAVETVMAAIAKRSFFFIFVHRDLIGKSASGAAIHKNGNLNFFFVFLQKWFTRVYAEVNC